MSRTIERVVVIGAGTMGGGIAAVAANAGVPVHLLDVVPVAPLFERLKASSPPPFLTPEAAGLVTIGDLDADFGCVGDADWIVEAIVEQLGPKRDLMARVERARKPGSVVSSNTSGLPISSIAAETSDDFKTHFLGTHFFNPPWFMKLLEVIPTGETSPEIVEFMIDFATNRLGKGVVVCKDTPNFVANRYGSITGASAFAYILANGYTVEEADAILGPVVGRPKTAVFRLYDLVGLDVASAVGANLYDLIPDDESREVLRDPRSRMLRSAQAERGRLGHKTGQGFYKRPPKGEDGEILTLDLDTLEYRSRVEPAIPSVEEAMKIADLGDRLSFVLAQDDRAGELARHVVYYTLGYASRRVPEIADDLCSIDRAVRWGYSHELGPFEIWDALGVRETVEAMRARGVEVAPWVEEMLSAGFDRFYRPGEVYDPATKSYVPLAE